MPEDIAMVARPDLRRLIYYSRNRITGPVREVDREVETILASSRRNNALRGVTGALICNLGLFVQVLEGAQADVETVFERIQCDERHGHVSVLALERVSARSFPDWSMAFLGHINQGEHIFSRIGLASCFETRRMEGERILAIMREMALAGKAGQKTLAL